jgi:hypothetical protein
MNLRAPSAAKAFLLLFLVSSAAALLGQDVNGTISGSITDPAGAAVVGATVRLVSETTDSVTTEQTNGEGNFIQEGPHRTNPSQTAVFIYLTRP